MMMMIVENQAGPDLIEKRSHISTDDMEVDRDLMIEIENTGEGQILEIEDEMIQRGSVKISAMGIRTVKTDKMNQRSILSKSKKRHFSNK